MAEDVEPGKQGFFPSDQSYQSDLSDSLTPIT